MKTQRKNKQNIKGVTLISLTVAVIILMLISSMIIYNAKSGIKIRNLKMMQNDIALLNDKVSTYYSKYGALPAEIEYLGRTFETGANDDDTYYVIDLNALEGLTLNYGLDYDKITETNSTDYTDVYIINKQSQRIYYVLGIELDGIRYYTNDEDDEDDEVTLNKMEPNNSTPNDEVTFSTAYGTIDVIWLSGTTNKVSTTPNEPILTSNGESMTPVTWTKYDNGKEDENGEIIVDDAGNTVNWFEDETAKSTWYNYSSANELEDTKESMWANAKNSDGSYFVWIPRFAYRITYYEGYTEDENGNYIPTGEPTGYYDGYGMWSASEKTTKYKLDDGVETVKYKGKSYIVHPAFCDNVDMGGWDSDLTGFWFAKYEMSGSGSTTSSTDTLKSVSNAKILSTTIGNFYLYARNANYGYTGTEETLTSAGTEYTHTSYMNSHLVKNSEWGAVAYLTQSQYGRNGNEIDINNSSTYRTGNGGGSTSASSNETEKGSEDISYKDVTVTGAKASTTGNIYGIFDMSGGMAENTAAYDKLSTGTDSSGVSYISGLDYGLYMTQEAKDSNGNYISTKYITAYSNGTDDYYGTKIYEVGKVGDATKEVYAGDTLWFLDTESFASSELPFFVRGGYYNFNSYAGVFASNARWNGEALRTVLCP